MAELLDCLFSSDLGKLTAIFEKINVNCVIPGTDGCTPLHVVAGMENSVNTENLISFLHEKGANPNARSFEKLTPVHIAAMWNNCFQLEKLLQNGGNPWLTDCENKNSFDMAADNYAYEASQLLHTYLHEDKFHFKNERKSFGSRNKDMVNIEFAQSKNEYSRAFSNTMFMTANENFPLILSSLDSCDESDFNIRKYVKGNHSSEYSQNNEAINDKSRDSVWNFSKCIRRNCSKHNQAEIDSSGESVLSISKSIKGNHSKHNQNNQAKNDSNGESAWNIGNSIKGKHSSKHNQGENDISEESVLYIGECIKGSYSKHNQANKDSSGENVLKLKCNRGNHSSKHNQAENDSSEESILHLSKCVKGNCSKHNHTINDSMISALNISKYIKRNHSSKHNQAENDSSGEGVLNICKCIKGNCSSKHNQAEKGRSSQSSNTSISKPKLNSTYKLSPRSAINKFNSSTKFHKNNLNHACFFSSSESETSDITPSTLNYSDDSSNYETIIESDDKSGIVLVEMKGNADNIYASDASVCSVASSWKSFQNVIQNCSTLNCSSHSKASVIIPESLLEYSNSRIFQELLNLGDNPGPVLDHTRHVYLLRLARLKTGCKVSCELPKPSEKIKANRHVLQLILVFSPEEDSTNFTSETCRQIFSPILYKYCSEIYQFIENKLDMIRARTLEQIMAAEFEADSAKKWREGNQRCCFNYFLLDPRVTQNLPTRMANLTNKETFLIFLDSLFYVGKGTRGRPYSHLFEAAKLMESKRWKCAKITHILEIWKAGLGVISLHCFHNSIPVEAYTREACILEAVGKYTVKQVADLGMANLTNIRKGDFYGSSAKLTTSRKRLIGISLLERALKIFLLEGERQIKPKDVQYK